eukprot:1435710-Karenia_brevis.AAC.1
MIPPGSYMEPGGSVHDPERVIFACFRPKVAKMSPPASYMEPGGSQTNLLIWTTAEVPVGTH